MAKRICFISYYAYPLFNNSCKATFGGAEVQLYQYAIELARLGYSVSFIVSDFGQPNIELIDGVKVIKGFNIFNKKLKYILGIYYQLQFLLKLITSNSDIYIQRAAGIETGIISIFCKLFRKKFIYMLASSIDADGGYRKNKPLEGIFYEIGIKNSSILVSQNNEQKNQLLEKFKLSSTIIKNSFTLPEVIPSQREYVLWVGTSQHLKQPELFLKLAEHFSHTRFLMIMPKNDIGFWNQIYKDIKKYSNLTFIEKVPFKEINKYFSKAIVFINTSTFEGFPNTFVQSAMYGTPILSLNVNPDNFLGKYNCGYFAHNDFNKLTSSLNSILNNKVKWSELSQNGIKYAKLHHDIHQNTKQLIQHF